MKFSRLLTSLVFFLPLALRATGVDYAIGNGHDNLIELITPDFIPNLPTATPNHWSFPVSAFTTRTCNDPRFGMETCTGLIVDITPSIDRPPLAIASFTFTYYVHDPLNTMTEGYGNFVSTDLSSYGQYESGPYELFVVPYSGPITPTPEPSTLALAGLTLLGGCWGIRKSKGAAKG